MNNPVVFISSPFSHPDAAIRSERTRNVARYEAYLRETWGFRAISPIAATGHLKGVPSNYLPWTPLNDRLLEIADLMHELRLPGWEDSQGMANEAAYARKLGKPVVAVVPHGDGWKPL
jgi:hypothetical protein